MPVNATPRLESALQLQVSSPAQDNRFGGGAQGAAEKKPSRAPAAGGQIIEESEIAQGGQIRNKRVGRTGKKGGQSSDSVISSSDSQGGQAASWLKSLLPVSQSGWWEVGVKGKGFAVKFRWRDTDRQTLLFPQINHEEFTVLSNSGPEEATRILRERIIANLHSFLFNPSKRDKALAVAAKLSIDLLYPPYTSNEQEDMGSD